MKKIVVLLSVLALFCATWAMAAPPDLGKKHVVPNNPPFYAELSGKTLKVHVGVTGAQVPLGAKDWQLSYSVAVYDSALKSWGEFQDQAVATRYSVNKDGKHYLVAEIPVEPGKDGYYRIWGFSKSLNKSLFINAIGSPSKCLDKYCRLDSNGNPGYELVLYKGAIEAVPAGTPAWDVKKK